jgi:predicted dehydrogenase
MSVSTKIVSSRREFLKNTGRIAAASALAGTVVPRVHAAENNTIKLALVGCGRRGAGAVANVLFINNGPTKLVAMADLFEDRLESSYTALKNRFKDMVDVPKDRKFLGFDAYKKAMDCLSPGDVAIFASPGAFRWVHFQYAVEKGLNVFMEKPVAVDGPSARKMLKLGEEAAKKNLKVGVGLMCRHCKARGELHKRVQAGEIGDVISLRAYRLNPPIHAVFLEPRPKGIDELTYQVKNFEAFLWASGGAVSDFAIHNIDESCWMKDAWPIEAKASGGRHFRGTCIDQNFDSYSIEYGFADGTKLHLYIRNMVGAYQEFASFAHGTKGSAIISTSSHYPARCRIFNSQSMTKKNQAWGFPQPETSPYELEWDDLINAIRQDKPYNEVQRGAEASLVTAMGRMAAHTGRVITYDEMLRCDHEFAPDLDKLTMGSPAPLQADASGKYPIPLPGINTQREY